MAKDTEKLIRQLSLISYLMAERRPVTAPEIRRDVEGYSAMNEDAFARRFYADRSELEALGIVLSVEKPVDGLVEQENYSLPPENFHLPPIEFTDEELAALHTALQLLDGEFAYAEPLRLALQQISWGRPEPAERARAAHRRARDHRLRRRPRRLAAAGQDRDRDLPPQDDRVRLLHDGARRHRHPARRSVPAALPGRPVLRRRPLARARGDPRLPSLADPRQGRLRDQGRARLPAPADFDPRAYANRIDWQFGEPIGTAEVWIGDRIAWQIERHFGRYGEMRPADDAGDRIFVTPYANARQLIAWVLGLGEHARIVGPPELVDELRERVAAARRAPLRRAASWRPWRRPARTPRPMRRPGARGAGAESEATATIPMRRSGPSASRGW